MTGAFLLQELQRLADVGLQNDVGSASSIGSEDCTDDITNEQNVKSMKQIMLHLSLLIAAREVEGEPEFTKQLDDLKRSQCRFLPVLSATGSRSLRGIQQDFFINDHTRWGAKFANKVDFLDFHCEESCKLKWLLDKFDLQNRTLSMQVEQLNEPQEESFDTEKTEDFRKRAYAFSWYVR